MKILLCGDYSSVHSELSKALKDFNHEVTLLSDGDSYKNFPADIKIPTKIKKRNILDKFLYFFLDFLGLYGLTEYKKTIKKIKLDEYDIIQLINPVVVEQFGAIGNYLFIRYLSKKTKKIFLCALGDDSRWVKASLSGTYKYSYFDTLKFNNIFKYYYSLKYLFNPAYYFLGKYVEYKTQGIISGLIDYKMAYDKYNIKTKLIRLPISINKFKEPSKELSINKIRIFHAWQYGKESRKGNEILDFAVKEVIKKFGSDKISYEIAGGLSYDEFIKKYDSSDIFLDQIYSYDRGVAAALGMCSGKVVFSGFEEEDVFSENSPSNIKKTGVNATSDVSLLIESLIYLIENPEVMLKIKENAYSFAKDNYDSKIVANHYVLQWNI